MNKKKFILFIICLFFLTGCSVNRLKVDKNYDYIVDNILLKSNKLSRTNFNGFSLYIPKGLKQIEKDDYNIIFKDKYNNDYYLYVDIVSYYNKTNKDFKKKNEVLYYEKSFEDENGYLHISVKKDKYFVEALYNYAKIEVYSDKSSLNDVVVNVCQLLSNIKYNDEVIKLSLSNEKLSDKEETFNIFAKKKTTTNYLDYVKKYDSKDSDNKVKTIEDKDTIDIEINED